METPQSGAKDPTMGVVLSLFCPGLGHLYAGSLRSFVIFLGIELWLFSESLIGALAVLHLFQAIAAGGAVKLWNSAHSVAAPADVPPPPPAGTYRPAEPPPLPPAPAAPPPPPTTTPVTLDPDEFLAELQAAWRDHRSSAITARQFADRKWRAIRAVRVDHGDEGHALVAAARELAHAGVLTSEEIGQLEARVAS